MKNHYVLLAALFFSFSMNAQIIDNLGPEFKNMLVNLDCVAPALGSVGTSDVDTNNDGEISLTEAEVVIHLVISEYDVIDATGIEFFINLESLSCTYSVLSSLNVSTLVNLKYLNCANNQLTELIGLANLTDLEVLSCHNNQLPELDLSNASNLGYLECYNNQLTNLTLGSSLAPIVIDCNDNQLTEIDISGYPNLDEFYIGNNFLTSLDISNNTNLSLIGANNNQITTLFMKNGVHQLDGGDDHYGYFSFGGNPLSYVCGDESEIGGIYAMLNWFEIENVNVNSYCSFDLGGEFYTIEGSVKIDSDSNGCDTGDTGLPHLNFSITNGTETGNFIANTTGNYSISVGEGTHTLTPTFENPDYFTVSPSNITVSFPTDTSPFMQNFCVTVNGVYKEIDIQIIPITAATPGFQSDYRIIYKNTGNTTIEFGQVLLTNDLDLMSEVSFNPSWDSFTLVDSAWHFNFEDLQPFETRTIDFSMLINTPMDAPAVNGDDVLTFTANYFIEYDEVESETAFVLEQTVVNSYDPNDKTCLEGAYITPEMVGDYIHYMIRFENTGTANAVNIVVKDNIDITKYDLTSIVPLHSSHDYFAKIKNNTQDNYVEFIFENINLPFDDANNDGYIVFKIKTLDTLALNDIIENEAEIYFDFNFPIITNNEQTTVATLSTDEFELANNTISLYPNPTTNTLHLESKHVIKKITVYDISGRSIKEIAVIGAKTEITISTEALSKGTYFVKIKNEIGEVVKKIIKD